MRPSAIRLRQSFVAFAIVTIAFLWTAETGFTQDGPAPDPPSDLDRRIQGLEGAIRQLQIQRGLAAPIPNAGWPAQAIGAEQLPQSTQPAANYAASQPTYGNSFRSSVFEIFQPLDPTLDRDSAGGSKKYPLVRITGLFQLDAIYADQTPTNLVAVGRALDALDFRRARIAATGNLTEDVTYLLQFDFASSQAQFVDLWVNWANIPGLGNVRIGRFRQPFGMSELTSFRELPFLERPLGFTLAPFRQSGISVWDSGIDDRVTWAIAGYRFQTDAFGNVIGNSGYGTAARLTALPIFDDEHHLIHVGLGYSFDSPATHTLTYSTFPEVFGGALNTGVNSSATLINPTFASTGAIALNNVNLFNVETALLYGPFALQSETRWSRVDQTKGGPKTLGASYIEARFVLTGEDIPFNPKSGVFTRVLPQRPLDFKGGGGCGAWELALRWSYIDLNGTNGNGPGGLLNDATIGVNWYMNNFTKFQFNYIRSILNQQATGVSYADFYALRFQMDFQTDSSASKA